MTKAGLIYFLFLFFAVHTAKAQLGIAGQEGVCVTGKSTMYIAPSTTLHVDGDFFIKKSQGPLWVRSNGIISLTGNLICNDPLICERADSLKPTCKFIFSPKTTSVSISGTTDSIILYHTIINKPNTIVKINSGTNIKILDTLDLQAGSVRLDGGNIYFIPPGGTPSYVNHPYLKNENHQNRIFGDSGRVIISLTASYLETTIAPANIGLTLKGQHVPNSILTINRGHEKQIYAGNGSIRRYFDVVSNQSLDNDSLFVNYIDSAEYINLGIDKNKLKIFVSPGGDMDYFQPYGNNSITQHLAKSATNSFSTVGINPQNFRITVADEDCSNPPISALPNGTLHLCQGEVQILDAGNNTSVPNTNLFWSWSTGDSTQTIAVSSNNAIQQFFVTMRDVRGCIIKDTVTIAPTAITPTVNFTAYSKCFGDSVKLISTSSGTQISNYNWKFGDADSLNTSSNDTIKKLYASSGKFYVTLTITSNYGCIASKLDSVWAFPLPTASFTSNFDCAGDLMVFTSNSSAGFGVIQNNYWNFDTASFTSSTLISPSINPTYSYSPPGTYSVKLMVETFQGCKDSITNNIVINPENSSAFTASNSCLGDTVSFINNSICNTGSCNYLWDFGDGTQSIAVSPQKIFTNATVYNVKLKILSSSGCPDSSSVPITISPKPIISFSSSPVCFGNISYFTNNSTISTGSIVSYAWDLGNSTFSTTTNTSLTYANSGNYSVRLTATSALGCVADLIRNAIVFQKPIAQYNVSSVCRGQASIFNQNSIGSALTYLWDFGNFGSSTISNPVYTYASSGNYTTSLIVTDTNSCSDTSSINTTVFSIPNPAMGGIITTCGNTYILDAGPGVNYLWLPTNASTQSITVITNGNYSVTVTDSNGCVGTDQVLVGLNTEVKPHLGNDTTSCGPYSLNAGYPGCIYLWNTGAVTQTLLVAVPSTYIVTVTDINNCIGKDTVEVLIETPPLLSLGADISQCKTAQPLELIASTDAGIYLWNDGSAQPSLSINTGGFYILTVTGNNGCKKSDTISVNLLPSPIVDIGPDAAVCGTKLLDAQNVGYNYLWSNGNTDQTIMAQVDSQYWVSVTNPSNGCIGKDTINLLINAPFNLFLGNDTSSCSNAAFVLNAGNLGSVYNWSTGDTTQTIIAGSSGAYGVTVTNGACSSFDVINISVLSAPVFNLGNNIRYICGNGSITINAGNSGNVNWGSDNGFSSAQQSITVNQEGIYWAMMSNGICSSSDTVQIIQSNQGLAAYFIASTIDTVGKPVKFVDVSQPTPDSWFWDFGDGFTSTMQSPEHIFLTVQIFNVSLTVSNGFCTSQISKSLDVRSLHPSFATGGNPSSLALIKFSLYPNPADKSFKTLFEINDAAAINFSIYEITGKLVYRQNRNLAAVFEEETDISELKNGLYMIEIIAENHKGFVIQKGKLLVTK